MEPAYGTAVEEYDQWSLNIDGSQIAKTITGGSLTTEDVYNALKPDMQGQARVDQVTWNGTSNAIEITTTDHLPVSISDIQQVRAGAFNYLGSGTPTVKTNHDGPHYTSLDINLAGSDYQPGDVWSVEINGVTIEYPEPEMTQLPSNIRQLAVGLANKIEENFAGKYYLGENAVQANIVGKTGATIRLEIPDAPGPSEPEASSSDAFTFAAVSVGGGEVEALIDIDHTVPSYGLSLIHI